MDGGNISNVNCSLVPLFVTVGPPTDELCSGMGGTLVEGELLTKVHRGSFVTSLFCAKDVSSVYHMTFLPLDSIIKIKGSQSEIR